MKWFIGIIIAGVLTVFFVFLKKKQDEVEASFQKRFAGKNIKFMDKYALYVARQSDGYSHFRAVGYLVLTEDELYFERQLDRKIFIIPIASIVSVEKTRRLAGQCLGGMLLKVVFSTPEGKQDAIVWKVKQLEQWIQEITSRQK